MIVEVQLAENILAVPPFAADQGMRGIIDFALASNATDVDCRPGRPIDFVILNRIVHTDIVFSDALANDLTSYLNIPSASKVGLGGQVEADERGTIKSGKLLEDGVTRVRVTKHGTSNPAGVSYAIRLLPELSHNRASAGIPDAFYRAVRDAKGGIAFVTGVTGSGKTTTGTIIVRDIISELPLKAVGIESPIEIVVDDGGLPGTYTQMEIPTDYRDAEEALEAFMWIRPRLILVWEITSPRVADLVLRLASAGHTVITTLHTATAKETVQRFVQFFPLDSRDSVYHILSSVLIACLGQRLVVDVEEKSLVLVPDLLINNPAIANAIAEDHLTDLESAMDVDTTSGMERLDKALIRLCYDEGRISDEVAYDAAVDKMSYCRAVQNSGQILPDIVPDAIRKALEV